VDIGTPAAPAIAADPQPARHAADTHEIRHDQIARLLLQRGVEVAGTVEVLADLKRCFELRGKLGEAVEVVVYDRLLDPGEAVIVDGVAALQGLAHVEALVEIDHQVHVVADGFPDGSQGRQVVAQPVATQSQL
jgi:hypothetical protein